MVSICYNEMFSEKGVYSGEVLQLLISLLGSAEGVSHETVLEMNGKKDIPRERRLSF